MKRYRAQTQTTYNEIWEIEAVDEGEAESLILDGDGVKVDEDFYSREVIDVEISDG